MVRDDETAIRKHLKVFIGALPLDVSEGEVGNHFAKYGHVLQVAVIQKQNDDRNKNSSYAFATFKFAADADCAVVDPQHFPGVRGTLNMGFASQKGKGGKKNDDDGGDTDQCKVFVGGMTDRDSEEQIGDFFSQWGLVVLVYRDRSWGFVSFATKEAAQRLLDERSVIFQRRRLEIKPSDSRKQMDEGERQELIKRAIARHFHKKSVAYPPPGYPPPGSYPPPGGGYPPPGYPPQGGYPPPGPHGAPPPSYYSAPPPGYPPQAGYPPPQAGYPPPSQGQAPPGYPPPSSGHYGSAPPSSAPQPSGSYYPPPGHYSGAPSGGPPPDGYSQAPQPAIGYAPSSDPYYSAHGPPPSSTPHDSRYRPY